MVQLLKSQSGPETAIGCSPDIRHTALILTSHIGLQTETFPSWILKNIKITLFCFSCLNTNNTKKNPPISRIA